MDRITGNGVNTMTQSDELFERSKKRIPGGVNSPVRAYQAVGRNPVFIKKAKGSHIFDEDGNEITINQGKTWVCVVYDTKEDQIVIE